MEKLLHPNIQALSVNHDARDDTQRRGALIHNDSDVAFWVLSDLQIDKVASTMAPFDEPHLLSIHRHLDLEQIALCTWTVPLVIKGHRAITHTTPTFDTRRASLGVATDVEDVNHSS